MSLYDYDHLPPWKRPTEYTDAPRIDGPDRPADVEDDPPARVDIFGVDDDDEREDADDTPTDFD